MWLQRFLPSTQIASPAHAARSDTYRRSQDGLTGAISNASACLFPSSVIDRIA